MPEIITSAGNRNYEISIRKGALFQTGTIAAGIVAGRRAYIVTDRNVAGYYLGTVVASLEGAGFKTAYSILAPGEASKSYENLIEVYGKFHEAGITRSDLIVALGGGVIGDLAGFAAATYLRGIAVLQIPTSLLAQVDSSVGGKTAINLSFGKNLVGAFHQPAAVIADPEVIRTLPEDEFSAGMAEVIKSGCIKDLELFEKIESGEAGLEWIIERCIRIKSAVVEEDEKDTGVRMLLNFGHTVGHAIEKVSGYVGFTHGQAVSAGMVAAAGLGEKLGVTKSGTSERMTSLLGNFKLPISSGLPAGDLIRAVRSDKKTMSETVYFVLLKEIGEAVLYPVSVKELEMLLAEVLS
ncbi:MAG: 3-dehydroquinate synthase [Eubacteriales bacterium]|nr:3-dehydroquinate synthase [Eubacteriales bacterium]MDD4326855.1 3-dehydroquinate synthase [Eubacteriales bacterium]MDD4716611.1 3-dehydroquinate synthase [Eubacteriales bacterium]